MGETGLRGLAAVAEVGGVGVEAGAGLAGVRGVCFATGVGRSAAPQFSQKAAPSSFLVPHFVQKIAMSIPFASLGLAFDFCTDAAGRR